ncbi:MAG: hypothetical protein KF901_00130 [Myxococcales bacterium]|nr:hypothetical protein [Myxococcales bacterium]
MRRASFVALALLSQAGCQRVCGEYTFDLPQTTSEYERTVSNAIEVCGAESGTQGNWEPDGESYVLFAPDERGLSTDFVYTNMLITVVFETSRVAEGVTLRGDQLGGNAFYGLGGFHTDESALVRAESSLTFHSVGEEEPSSSLFRRRIVDLEWDLVWSNGTARWTASGRDQIPMLRSTR